MATIVKTRNSGDSKDSKAESGLAKHEPNQTNLLINKGAAYFSDGNMPLAIKSFLHAVKLSPDSCEANFNLGLCYLKEVETDKAIKCFERVLSSEPHDFEALNNLGNLYLGRGEVKGAIGFYKKAVLINPKLYEGFYNLGVCFQELSENDKAIEFYEKSLKIFPDNEKVLNNLAVAYKRVGRTDKAIETFEQALESNPNLTMLLSNLGSLLLFQDPRKSLTFLAKAVEKSPRDVGALYNIGIAYQILGEVEKSLEAFKKIIKIDPDFEQVYGQLFLKLRSVADWDKAKKILFKMEKISKAALAGGRIPPETPFISVSTFQDPKRNFEIARTWSNFDKSLVANFPFKPVYVKKSKNEPINIGYASYDFHDHATVHLMLGVLRNHDKKKFKIHAYSYGHDSQSHYRKMVQESVHKFRDIRQLSDLESANLINKDKIDILVDLKGHTSGCRLGIFALRPAPITVTWLGFPGSTGADFFDYLIADKTVAPPEELKFYSEKVLYMPDTYQPTDNKQVIANRRFIRRDFGLPADPDAIVFSSFNQIYKINSKVFDSWMKILQKVPSGVLWLWQDNETVRENLKKEAKKRGIAPGRIIFANPLSKTEHLKRLTLADIALDTFIYNGHTTTSDCLWAGVPVVTLKGKHFASRVSASLLTAVGLPELITNTPKEYEDLAIELATNPKKLSAIRQKLSANRLTSSLFDTEKFTSNLEKAYEAIWKNYLEGKKPESLEV